MPAHSCKTLCLLALLTGLFFQAPVAAKEPPGLRHLLSAALAQEDEASFDRMIDLALTTWPGDKKDILALGRELNGDWLNGDLQQSLDALITAEAEATEAEKARGFWYYADPKYWSPRLELGAGTATGDTEEQSLTLGMSIERDFDGKWKHNARLNIDYAERQGVTTRERFDFIQESLWRVFDKGYLNNFTQFEVDRFSGFDWRLTEVVGVSYDLLSKKGHGLTVSGGPGFRFSREEGETIDGVTLNDSTRNELIVRLAADYRLALGDGVALHNTAAAAFGTGSTRLDNGLALTATFNSSLSASMRFNVVYESDVPVGTSEIDTVTRATLIYTF